MPEKDFLVEEIAIGIDLGTTYCRVAVWQHRCVKIIANDRGNKHTPSYVAFTESDILVGDVAKDQVWKDPGSGISGAKRLIGRSFNEASIQDNIKRWPFEVHPSGSNKLKLSVQHKGKKKLSTCEEIVSLILLKIIKMAEDYLGSNVKNACVAIPYCFNSTQRQATQDACAAAGLNVRLLYDSCCAGIAYGLDKVGTSVGVETILVFDLGSGTLDVTIFEFLEGIFEVIATTGDAQLGGEDFDKRLVSHLVREFNRKFQKDISSEPGALIRLSAAAERAKRILSSSTQTTIEISSLYKGIDFHTKITRSQFEEINLDLFRKCLDSVEKCLRDAGVDKSCIQELVLVGGSSHIPKVQQLLQEFFDNKITFCQSINPEEAVVYGAAVYAAVLFNPPRELDALLCQNATPYSLGIETVGGLMTVLIPKNEQYPTLREITFTTSVENQSTMSICVYEGESTKTKDNIFLGEFELSGIPVAPRGVPEIVVRLDTDANGILNVSATDKATGQKVKMTMGLEVGILRHLTGNFPIQFEEGEKKKHTNAANYESSEDEHVGVTQRKRELVSKIPRQYLELATELTKEVQRLTSSIDSGLSHIYQAQCQYVVGKLRKAVKGAHDYIDFSTVEDIPHCHTICKKICQVAKEVNRLVHDCGNDQWLRAAIILADPTEYVLSLVLELDLCTILLQNRLQGKRVDETFCEFVSIQEVESSIIKDKALVDRKMLLSRLDTQVGSIHLSNGEIDLAHYLIKRLQTLFGQGLGSRDVSDVKNWKVEYKSLKQLEKIGKGSFATVHTTIWLEEYFAEKTFFGTDPKIFMNEVSIQARLSHPNIVPLIGYAINSRSCSLIMELMDGTLLHLIQEKMRDETCHSPFDLSEVVDIVLQIAEGMHYLHQNKVVHRDLKSENVLIKRVKAHTTKLQDEHILVKVADFGLSKVKESSCTFSNQTMNTGSTRWMAPELFGGAYYQSQIDMPNIGEPLYLKYPFKSDIYSFAMVCYEIVTGNVPFFNEGNGRVRKMVLEGSRPEIPKRWPHGLVSLIERCWNSFPETRPSFAEICVELRRLKCSFMIGEQEITLPSKDIRQLTENSASSTLEKNANKINKEKGDFWKGIRGWFQKKVE